MKSGVMAGGGAGSGASSAVSTKSYLFNSSMNNLVFAFESNLIRYHKFKSGKVLSERFSPFNFKSINSISDKVKRGFMETTELIRSEGKISRRVSASVPLLNLISIFLEILVDARLKEFLGIEASTPAPLGTLIPCRTSRKATSITMSRNSSLKVNRKSSRSLDRVDDFIFSSSSN